MINMRPVNMLFKALFLLSSVYTQTISGCEIYHFVPTDGQALEGHVIKTITKSLVNFCWGDCVWLPWCFSINVHQTSDGMFECELNNSSKKANSSKMASREGWSYHEMKEVNNAQCKMYDCKIKEDLGNGWYRYGNSKIKLFSEKKSWTDARSHCQSLGGDLLSITSSHENDFVNDVFVENQNLTYNAQDISKTSNNPSHNYKLNGEEPDVQLMGPPGDSTFKFEGREKALYLNGQYGFAKVPGTSMPGGFFISFWAKVLNNTEIWSTLLSIYDSVTSQSKFMVSINGQTNDVYCSVGLGNASVKRMFAQRFERNVWQHFIVKFVSSKRSLEFGYQGTWSNGNKYDVGISTFNFTESDRFVIGSESLAGVQSNKSFHGFMKHLVFVKSPLMAHKMQNIMYWHEQGVWIGLNNPEGSPGFSWSDGTPVGQFMNLPDYNPEPTLTLRKCVAMAKDKKWLDKHCDLKYPFLCEIAVV